MEKTLSVIIPAYNESESFCEVISLLGSLELPHGYGMQLILVDDGSTDGTRDHVTSFTGTHDVAFHAQNRGKGAAVRTGLGVARGEYVVIQDADLEYDPADMARMLGEMVDRDLRVLYGSRRLGKVFPRNSGIIFYVGGLLLTWLTNILYNQRITDEPTCYKMFKTEVIKGLPLTSERFEFCPEVTALTARAGHRIPEIPISYNPRSIGEGKKIRFKDWFEAVWTLLKHRF